MEVINEKINTSTIGMTKNDMISEDFLHFVWKYKCIPVHTLKTTEGEDIILHKAGFYNTDSGPDFVDAELTINGIKWVGTVEIHTHSSLWNAHRHSEDVAYNNVILHVVYEHDKEIYTASGNKIPTLELKSILPEGVLNRYQTLKSEKDWLPCSAHIQTITSLEREIALESVFIERLESKINRIENVFEEVQHDWDELFYRVFLKYFGASVNSLPFEHLAETLSFKILMKNADKTSLIEALLFGQAGFLEGTIEDVYYQQLQKDYIYLQTKYNLKPIGKQEWKFLRLRPAAFPTFRLAQLGALIQTGALTFSNYLENLSLDKIQTRFNVKVSDYWNTHYHFQRHSEKHPTSIGKSTIHIFIINVIVPLVFFYGRRNALPHLEEAALQLIQQIPNEQNTILKDWKVKGVGYSNALQSQALIHLRKEYCERFRCLECRWGQKILTQYKNE